MMNKMQTVPAPTFHPLTQQESETLRHVLRQNAYGVGGLALKMNPRDTSFDGSGDVDDVADADVIDAIRSVPTHYMADTTCPICGKPRMADGSSPCPLCGK